MLTAIPRSRSRLERGILNAGKTFNTQHPIDAARGCLHNAFIGCWMFVRSVSLILNANWNNSRWAFGAWVMARLARPPASLVPSSSSAERRHPPERGAFPAFRRGRPAWPNLRPSRQSGRPDWRNVYATCRGGFPAVRNFLPAGMSARPPIARDRPGLRSGCPVTGSRVSEIRIRRPAPCRDAPALTPLYFELRTRTAFIAGHPIATAQRFDRCSPIRLNSVFASFPIARLSSRFSLNSSAAGVSRSIIRRRSSFAQGLRYSSTTEAPRPSSTTRASAGWLARPMKTQARRPMSMLSSESLRWIASL